MKKFITSVFIQFCIAIFLLSLSTSGVRAQWVQTNGPAGVYSFAVSGSNLFAATEGAGVFRSTDDGINWVAVNTGLTDTYVGVLAVSGTNLFVGTGGGGGVFLSTNNGASWTPINNGLTGHKHILALGANGTNIFAGTDSGAISGFYRSTNNGTNWTELTTGSTFPVYAIAFSGTNVFAGSGGGVHRSTDNGASWTVNIGMLNTVINDLVVSGTNIFAVAPYVYLSTNNGNNWTPLGGGDPRVRRIAVSGSNLFTSTEFSGINLSTDNGTSWTSVNTGLTSFSINPLAVSGAYLVASSNHFWRRPLSEMIGVNSVSSKTLSSITLEQNNPNPFSTSTTMRYSIPNREHVRITLSNPLGQKLATLLDEDVDAGAHDLTIRANNLPSGVYVVTMTADGVSKSQKICVQK